MVSLEFFIDIILPAALWPWADSDSNRNEYQVYFLGVKSVAAWGWQPYHLQVPIVLKSGSLKFLEPSGSVQVCNGIALPLYKALKFSTANVTVKTYFSLFLKIIFNKTFLFKRKSP